MLIISVVGFIGVIKNYIAGQPSEIGFLLIAVGGFFGVVTSFIDSVKYYIALSKGITTTGQTKEAKKSQ